MPSHSNSPQGEEPSANSDWSWRDTRLLILCLAQNVAEFKGFPPPGIYHQTFYMLYKCKGKPCLPSAKPSVCRWCGSLPASCGAAEERSWQQRADRCRDAQGVWVQMRMQWSPCSEPAGLWQPWGKILEICQSPAGFTSERRQGV